MSQSLSTVIIHIVFSTKNREKLLSEKICAELYPYITTMLRNHECHPYKIGGMADHIHILCKLSKTITISDLIGKIKFATSKFVKNKISKSQKFSWQNGYGVFSVGQSLLDIVCAYIANQSQHHKIRTYEDELVNLLNKYKINYDERYLWN
jgi:putative transposase